MRIKTCFAVALLVLVPVWGFKLAPKLDGRIVSGEDANIRDFPYMASLTYKELHRCGASIIKSNVILTAAYCTHQSDLIHRQLGARTGTSDIAIGGEHVFAWSVHTHHSYNPLLNNDYDASVVVLEAHLTVGIPIRLQPRGTIVPSGTVSVVTGWGHTVHGGSNSRRLQMVRVNAISDYECRQMYSDKRMTDRMVCTYTPYRDACHNDFGGPVVANGYQFGIVSWGDGCAKPNAPRVYAKVAHPEIYDFIDSFLS